MARRVFFSFHYERDVWRVSQVRNSGVVVAPGDTAVGLIDAAEWQTISRQGDRAIERWIDAQMDGTSVTVVLIGSQTAQRPWVQYEIRKSVERGNGMLGVYIHNVLDSNRFLDTQGSNPFDQFVFSGTQAALSSKYRTYDWVLQSGRSNLPRWIEEAARAAGR